MAGVSAVGEGALRLKLRGMASSEENGAACVYYILGTTVLFRSSLPLCRRAEEVFSHEKKEEGGISPATERRKNTVNYGA